MRERMNKKESRGLGIQNPGSSCVRVATAITTIPKICIHHYECRHCAFDQWLEEMEGRVLSVPEEGVEKGLLAEAA